MEETIKLSHLSDNQIRIPSLTAEGSAIQVDLEKEWLKVHLRCGDRAMTAINDGENSKYCHIEEGKLVLDIPAKTFRSGVLEYAIEVREESPYFKDGFKNTLGYYKQVEIEFV